MGYVNTRPDTLRLLSSHAALEDIKSLHAPALAKSHVLHFVAHPDSTTVRTSKEELINKYDIANLYFHLPNQFWAHKNHRVVIEALAKLKAAGRPVLVLCTGHTSDMKQPTFFNELMALAKAKGVENHFRVLGLVSSADLYGLMEHAVALINPSHFEGWSTTVEEAKALGKTILLSDLAVHREQEPARGVFFPADDAEMLAVHLWAVLNDFDPQVDQQGMTAAAANHHERFLALGKNYQQIVQSTLC